MKNCGELLKGWLIALGFTGIIVIIILLGLFAFTFVAEAQDCNFFDGSLISDTTVPLGNTDHCDHQGRVSLVCNQVVVEAYLEGSFFIYENFTGRSWTTYLTSGQKYVVSPNDNAEWVEVWSDDGFLGLVDIVEQECDDVVYPPDDRVNWQGGDYFAVAYIVGDYLSIYNVETGGGELVLQVSLPTLEEEACTEDFSVCVYVLSDGTIQLNIVDREGKLYELPVHKRPE